MNSSFTWALVMASAWVPAPLPGQVEMMFFQSKVPQADSRQELDSFLDLVQATTPKEALLLATHFRAKFPRSEFTAQTYRLEMNAHRELEDYQTAICAGEHALRLNPDDLETLLILADLLSRVPDNDHIEAVLSTAEHYAERALEGIAALKAVRSISLENWRRQTGKMKAAAHSVLGVIAFKRGQHSVSIKEFETSLRENPATDGTQHYMLGLAYRLSGNPARAITALSRASQLGPDAIRVRAEKELTALEKSP